MKISVKPENEAFLQSLVDKGAYPSIEEAADAAIAIFRGHDDQDLSWAKKYVDPAIASLDRGEGVSREEAFGRVRKHIDTKRS